MVDPNSSRGASLYSFFIACAAFTSCFNLPVFLQTLDGQNHHSSESEYPKLSNESGYYDADLVYIIIFTPELLVRLVIWPSLGREHEYLTERRLKPFLRAFFNWFDVAAIVPFYTDLIFVLRRKATWQAGFAVMIIMSGTLFLSMSLAIIGTEFDRAWKQHAESVKKFQQLQSGCRGEGL
ncbi:uncharacterized protein PITG_12314 [Phytophthora infestans T30-4]|uniref:Ion transport domain-containing protein n=2 Tax=Phytophthora infestans TaxID=4787 RepID=D0NJK6_PHYIT|nr:uncharacterized protein PITG_12314 [Phytophthora infestans T30-4]EEY59724.1 conserved hypothetical protein [Phytophthora infestans T30-4]KAF4041253.1 Ion transport protein [Phytophthora infestans]KAF4149654.1 Ion transport protein [Phytophthora infestans]KAI9999136.1 hypothetical protein PInf_003954 [Phytophthora infestans]|eukprot:XP_002900917.1 conserved hypothetical protein [Phytophthora infestans T30-4]